MAGPWTTDFATSAGSPFPLGASLTGEGVNFAVFSAHATAVELCLFSPNGRKEIKRLPLRERDGDIWHIHVAGLSQGQAYGYRVHGPYQPEKGHRFNPNKLLLDPYARGLVGRLRWSDALMGYRVGSAKEDLSFDTRDSAFAVPKGVVVDPAFGWGDDHPPRHSLDQSLLYEAHLRALTQRHPKVEKGCRGTYLGLASDVVIDHLLDIGVTAIELMPIHSMVDERFLVSKGLRNHWGYNTLGFFAPESRYMSKGGLWEVQTMVRRLHAAGIEVILDVVYNHSAESDEWGPTLSFRGLDNASYYRLTDGGRRYVNDAGTGNILALDHPMVLRMVMDSLRYWVEHCHIDGFRFDLATVLGRKATGFDPRGGFFDTLRQDPILNRVKLIAEPWDIGPNGYQLGAFGHPFSEWNDQYRDTLRRFWRGDHGQTADLAARILGSAAQFDHAARAATSSVNFITSHDGFTLQDLVSYRVKRNLPNGEANRDGHHANHSDNLGQEGPSDDLDIRAARALRKRNLLAVLFLSQGLPMLLSGDEIGHSQAGNNNAYAQDNETTWLDWQTADVELSSFVARLAQIRRENPILRQRQFLHARLRQADGLRDVIWRNPDGSEPTADQWHAPDFNCLCLELRLAAERDDPSTEALFIVINRGNQTPLILPKTADGWTVILDTSRPDLLSAKPPSVVPQNAVLLLRASR